MLLQSSWSWSWYRIASARNDYTVIWIKHWTIICNNYVSLLGHYMYIETTRQNIPATAILKSVEFFKERTYCYFDFYYHAFGDHVGELRLDIKIVTSETGSVEFPYRIVEPGQSNDTWIHYSSYVPDYMGYYTVSTSHVVCSFLCLLLMLYLKCRYYCARRNQWNHLRNCTKK